MLIHKMRLDEYMAVLDVPIPQPDVSFDERKDAGGTGKYLQGKRIPSRM